MFTRSSPGICPHIQCVALESELSEPLLHPKPDELFSTPNGPLASPRTTSWSLGPPKRFTKFTGASQARLWPRFEGVNLIGRSSPKVHPIEALAICSAPHPGTAKAVRLFFGACGCTPVAKLNSRVASSPEMRR